MLFHLAGGHAGVFAIGLLFLGELSLTADNRSANMAEDASTQELVEGTDFMDTLKRCFEAGMVDDDSRQSIIDALVDAYKVDMDVGRGQVVTSADQSGPIVKLKKAGILSTTNRFSCPAAARFYYSYIFPRAKEKTVESLDALIEEATRNLSARRLRMSRQMKNEKYQPPKEAVYQQLFHETIASVLDISYSIIPELGTEAAFNGKRVTGELDFYIRNGNKWAVELLRERKEIGEHLGRISGKYKDVEADSWLVVDCRAESGRPTKFHPHRCSLVFSEDFKTCQCYMRPNKEPTLIKLKD